MSNDSAKFFKLLLISRIDRQPLSAEEIVKFNPYLEHDPSSDDITKQVFFKGFQHVVVQAETRLELMVFLDKNALPNTYMLTEASFVFKNARIVRKATEAIG